MLFLKFISTSISSFNPYLHPKDFSSLTAYPLSITIILLLCSKEHTCTVMYNTHIYKYELTAKFYNKLVKYLRSNSETYNWLPFNIITIDGTLKKRILLVVDITQYFVKMAMCIHGVVCVMRCLLLLLYLVDLQSA